MPQSAVSPDFKSRLQLILGPRKKTPWATAMQIPSGTMTRMFGEGIPPTYETLAKVMRTENVSLSWLLGGDCPPYLYSSTPDDAVTAQELAARLDDEASWVLHVISDGAICVFALTQPASIEERKGSIPYNAVEIIAGPIGKRTAATLAKLPDARVGHLVKVTDQQIRNFYSTGIGTFQLLGDADTEGLLPRHYPREQKAFAGDMELSSWLIGGLHVSAAPRPEYLPPTLDRITRAWGKFNDEEQRALSIIMDPLLAIVETRPTPATDKI